MSNSEEEEPLRNDEEHGRSFPEGSSQRQSQHRCLVALQWLSLPLLLTLSMAILLIPMEQFNGDHTSGSPATVNRPNGATQNQNYNQGHNEDQSQNESQSQDQGHHSHSSSLPSSYSPRPPPGSPMAEDSGSENDSDTDNNSEPDVDQNSNKGGGVGTENADGDADDSEDPEDPDYQSQSSKNNDDDDDDDDDDDRGTDDADNYPDGDAENDTGNDTEDDTDNNDTENDTENESENDTEYDADHSSESRKEVEWEHLFIDLNGLHISYYETVQSPDVTKPKLVFLHGIISSAAVLIPVFNHLANDFHILLPDARGHGDSQPIPSNSFTMMSMRTDALQIIDHFRDEVNDEAIFLGGTNMGASIAASVAQYSPSTVKALVLEEPPWNHGSNDPPKSSNRQLPPFFGRSRSLKKLPNSSFADLNAVGGKVNPPAHSHLEALRMFDADEIEPTYWDTENLVTQEAGVIDRPILLQLAKANSLCTKEVEEHMMQIWPRVEKAFFDNVAAKNGLHAFHFTHMEQWLTGVRTFLLDHM